MKNELYNVELLCWDNEGAGEGSSGEGSSGEGSSGEGTGGESTSGGEGKSEKSFTQDEVNKFVAERNKAANVLLKQLEESNENLLKQQNLTKEQKDKVASDLDAVRNEMMTKEQRAESDKKKVEASYKADLENATKEVERYKTLYETSTINREIQDATIKHEGFSPTQFIAHLAPQSKMVEESIDGVVTGKLVARVDWTSVDEEGVKHTSEITPEEAVQKMKENVVDFGNMFKTNVVAGIGQGTAPGQVSSTGKVDQKNITDADYMKLSSTPEGREALGLPPLRR